MAILAQKKTYSAYYGDFRGVDFSNDHTQVDTRRFAYAVNMYKDYQSGEGKAIETIPGFRRRFKSPAGAPIYGVHTFAPRGGEEIVLVHAGSALYLWSDISKTVNVELDAAVILPAPTQVEVVGTTIDQFIVTLDAISPAAVVAVTKTDGTKLDNDLWGFAEGLLTIQSSELRDGGTVTVTYMETVLKGEDAVYSGMSPQKSTSFVFNNRLYLIDGVNYIYFDGEGIHNVVDNVYIPTTYIGIVPGGELGDSGAEYEQRNMLTPYFYNTFYADGVTKEFYLNDSNLLEGDVVVTVYGEVQSADAYSFDHEKGLVTFSKAPAKPEDAGYPESYAGIMVKAGKALGDSNAITGCTIAAVHADRIFFSGNPNYPCRIWYSGRNAFTGVIDPTYFPILHRVDAGVSNVPVTALLSVADTLMALKGDTQQDGSVYYFTPVTTGDDVVPIVYQSVRGLAGIGCLGAAVNFLDDPVFVSRLGLEGVGQLSTRLERAIEHRSSLVDAKLANAPLENASLAEWNGYLWLLCDGEVYLADSRQRFTHDGGTMQYEWYYLNDIGIYDSQYEEYRYADRLYDELIGLHVPYADAHGEEWMLPLALHGNAGKVANPPDVSGAQSVTVYSITVDNRRVSYVVEPVTSAGGEIIGYEAFFVTSKGGMTGGVFHAANAVYSMHNNVYFSTESGELCSFNFDLRDEDGEIPSLEYTFNGRAIYCGCATKMDNCGVPGMTKSTVKKSTVIKMKALQVIATRVKVRTNNKPYEQISRIGSARFTFDNIDFDDFSFTDESDGLFAVKEKEKKWVEKQYYLYSDEFRRPFALYYLTYRYHVAGRYKQ